MSDNRMPQNQESNKVGVIIGAILGILYGVSPVDVLPDILPVAGQLDDIVITGGALLNLAQSYAKDTSNTLATILGLFKWILIILGGILVVLVALFGVAIYKIFF